MALLGNFKWTRNSNEKSEINYVFQEKKLKNFFVFIHSLGKIKYKYDTIYQKLINNYNKHQ